MAIRRKPPGDLPLSSTVVQALDNQWIPRALLQRLVDARKARADFRAEIDDRARLEFMRALVNSRSVLVNRASLINSPVLRDELITSALRPQIGRLFNTEAIVPFLLAEETLAATPSYTVEVPQVLKALAEVERQFDVSCTRLSWDDQENARLVTHVTGEFHRFVAELYTADMPMLLSALGLPTDAGARVRDTLVRLHRIASDHYITKGKPITREEVYSQFVCADGDNSVARGAYDPVQKPLALEIKQLVDVKYLVNIPDALGANALTAQDSMSRSALPFQEPRIRRGGSDDPGAIVRQVLALRHYEYITTDMARAKLTHLTIEDLANLRERAEWREYIDAMESLLNNPFEFASPHLGIGNVAARWLPVNRLIAEMRARRLGAKTIHAVEPIAIVLSFGVHGLDTVLRLKVLGERILVKVFRSRVEQLHDRAAKLVGSFLLRTERDTSNADIDNEQQFITQSVRHGSDYFQTLIASLRAEGAEIEELSQPAAAAEQAAADAPSEAALPDESSLE